MTGLNEELVKQLRFRPKSLVFVETVLLVCINVAALFGNLFVCWAVYKNQRLRTIVNIFIVALAMSDILMATLSMPCSCVVLATERWVFGEEFCQFQLKGFSIFVLALLSVQIMSATAINRYFNVVKPTFYRSSKYFTVRFTIYTILLTVVLVSVSAGLLCTWSRFEPHPGKLFCFPRFNSQRDEIGYIAFLDVCFLSLPISILSFCYIQIFRAVRAHKRTATTLTQLDVSELKINKVLLATVVTFTICWAPVIVIDLIGAISSHSVNIPRQVFLMNIHLGYSSSSVNPFIYGLMNRAFRREFQKILLQIPSRVRPVSSAQNTGN